MGGTLTTLLSLGEMVRGAGGGYSHHPPLPRGDGEGGWWGVLSPWVIYSYIHIEAKRNTLIGFLRAVSPIFVTALALQKSSSLYLFISSE